MKKTKRIGAIAAGVIIIGGLVLTANCVEKVPAGYVGVVYNLNGGVEETVLTQGWHIVSPTKKVTNYSASIEQSYLTKSADVGDSENDESFNIPTRDGKTINVDLEFSYHFDSEQVASLFTRFKGQDGVSIKNSFIKPKVIAWVGEVSSQYPVTDIFGDKRAELNIAAKEHLAKQFEPYGIVIDTVNFTRIDTDKETSEAIQKKVNAQQELELAKIQRQTAVEQAEKDKETALINAEKDREVALVEAEKKKIAAQADADAVKVKAEAEAKANKMLAESINANLIDKTYADKWNGELPVVNGGSSANIMDINSLLKNK